jgi:hypothetical protein
LSEFLLQTSDKFNVKASGLMVEKLLDEPAEAIHGLPTKHWRYKFSFNASYKYMLFKGQYAMARQADYWFTPDSGTIATTVPFFQNVWQHTGEEQLDPQLVSVASTITGFQLRSELQQSRTNKKGEVSNTNIVQYVRMLREVDDLPTDAFALPDCDQVGAKKMEKKFKVLLKDLLK